jgi:hypothetical protein
MRPLRIRTAAVFSTRSPAPEISVNSLSSIMADAASHTWTPATLARFRVSRVISPVPD